MLLAEEFMKMRPKGASSTHQTLAIVVGHQYEHDDLSDNSHYFDRNSHEHTEVLLSGTLTPVVHNRQFVPQLLDLVRHIISPGQFIFTPMFMVTG